MKKSLIITSLFIGISLTSCNLSNDEKAIKDDQKFTLQAATSLNLVKSISNVNKFNLSKKSDISENDINEIKEILPQLDLMLENGYTFNSQISEVNKEINNETYKYQEIITFKGLNEEYVTYNLFYNSPKEIKEVDDDEIEIKQIMNGVATFDNNNYYSFISLSESEKEDDELEDKRIFKINMNNESYIKVEESYEIEGKEIENKFKYTVVENGTKTLEYKVKQEIETNKEKLEYELNDIEYKLVKEFDKDNNRTLYIIKYENEDLDKEFKLKFEKIVLENGDVIFNQI